MDPYLVELARSAETMDNRDEINEALDMLEYLYDALDSEQQDMASLLMRKLHDRLRELP